METTADNVPQLSIVVPAWNEEQNIPDLVKEIAGLTQQLPPFELILVDDGSNDATWQRISEAGQRYDFVRGIHYRPNRGQSAAMLAGFSAAHGSIIATLDSDMQNDPADIPRMLAILDKADCVCGCRARRKDTWSRRMASRLANRIRNMVTHDGVRDAGCTLKVFRRTCLADLPPLDGFHRFIPAYFRLGGRKILEVPVNHRPRKFGRSKYTNLQRLPRTILDLIGFWWYRRRFLQRPPTSPQ